jgi:RNA polymerase sigma-70 factor (ECF subfamily)
MEIPELLDRCRRGDELAWETLVRRFQGRIYGLAFHYTGNAEEARDLAQDIFIRLYRRLDACTNDETFIPWLTRMARNACIDRLRRIKARPQGGVTPVDEMYDLAAPGPDPSEEWRTTRRRNLVHRAMQKLSGINREIIVLKEIQGLTFDEIASILKVPVGTVKSRSNRARTDLARELVSLTRGPAGSPEDLKP